MISDISPLIPIIEASLDGGEANISIFAEAGSKEKIAAIYFSSNGIFYPDTPEVFQKTVMEQNRFEWHKNRIRHASLHIFVRDIQKSWYLAGINRHLNSVVRLAEYLKLRTAGYRIVTVGVSSGGYAAMLAGELLHAEAVLNFAGQFSLIPSLEALTPEKYPFFARIRGREDCQCYFDLSPLLQKSRTPIYYFCPVHSESDQKQLEIAQRIAAVRTFRINSNIHGMPISYNSLDQVLQMTPADWANCHREIGLKELGPNAFFRKYAPLFKQVRYLFEAGIRILHKDA